MVTFRKGRKKRQLVGVRFEAGARVGGMAGSRVGGEGVAGVGTGWR